MSKYQNRMESSSTRDERIVTVRRGFNLQHDGATYSYGYLTTPESPEYLSNKSAWILAPADLIERGATAPAPALPEPAVDEWVAPAVEEGDGGEADED